MNATYIDPVFGEMQYKHRWYKEEKISLFASEWIITIAAKAYSGKPITDQQRASYERFNDHLSDMANIIANQLIEYINVNCDDLAMHWIGARTISSAHELAQIVKPKTFLIK